MKTKSSSILALAFALATLTLAAAPAAQAGDYAPHTHTRTVLVDYCATAPRFLCTKELCRRTECRYALDHCGRRVSFQVVVITYADFYSDGSSRSYNRTYRA